MWLAEVFGYVLLASYEERYLLSELEKTINNTNKKFHLFSQ